MKKLSKTQWRKFESIVYEIIKDILKCNVSEPISKLTQETADGGYDGLFLLPYVSDTIMADVQSYYKILFEAKLRYNHIADLPLQDFSKALIIAINTNADAIIVATNLHLSPKTRKHLEDFSVKTGLQVFYLPPKHIHVWVENHLEVINEKRYNTLLKLLYASAERENINHEFTQIGGVDTEKNILPSLIGQSRKKELNNIGELLAQQDGILLLEGAAGVGKTFFIEHLNEKLSSDKMFVYSMNLENFCTPRVLFINILQCLWCIPLSIFMTMDVKHLREAIENIDESELEEKEREVIISALSQDIDTYNASADLFNYYMVQYLSKVYQVRQRHSKMVFYFSNLNAISSQMMDFVLDFINVFSKQSKIILEIRTSEYLDFKMTPDMWNSYVEKFRHHFMLRRIYKLEEFKLEEGYSFIKSSLNDMKLSISLMNKMMELIGKNPLLLGSLVEYLKISGFFQKVPQKLWEQNLDSILLDHQWYIIQLLIDAFCSKDSIYPAFFEMIKWFRGLVPKECVVYILEGFTEDKIDLMVKANLIAIDSGNYKVNHPLQLAVLSQKNYCTESYKQKLTLLTLEWINGASKDLDVETKYIIKFTLYQNLNNSNKVIDIGFRLAKNFYHAGQFALSYEYARTTYNYLNDIIQQNATILIKIELLEYLVQICLYLKGDSLEMLPIYMDDLEESINNCTSSFKENPQFQELKLTYYMDKNRFEHCYGEFGKSFDTMVTAYQMTLNTDKLSEASITNVWVEYAIALKECKSRKVALDFLSNARKIYPDSRDLRFTFNTQKYEELVYTLPEKALEYLLDNANITPAVEPAEIYHNRVHIYNLNFYLKRYDLLQSDGIQDLLKTSSMGLKNEEGRLSNLIGNVYYASDNLEEALQYYQYGINIYEGNNYVSNLWPILVNRSTLYLEKHNYELAYLDTKHAVQIIISSYLKRAQDEQQQQTLTGKLKAAVLILYRNAMILEKQPFDYPQNIKRYIEINLFASSFKKQVKGLDIINLELILQGTVFHHNNRFLLGY